MIEINLFFIFIYVNNIVLTFRISHKHTDLIVYINNLQ